MSFPAFGEFWLFAAEVAFAFAICMVGLVMAALAVMSLIIIPASAPAPELTSFRSSSSSASRRSSLSAWERGVPPANAARRNWFRFPAYGGAPRCCSTRRFAVCVAADRSSPPHHLVRAASWPGPVGLVIIIQFGPAGIIFRTRSNGSRPCPRRKQWTSRRRLTCRNEVCSLPESRRTQREPWNWDGGTWAHRLVAVVVVFRAVFVHHHAVVKPSLLFPELFYGGPSIEGEVQLG